MSKYSFKDFRKGDVSVEFAWGEVKELFDFLAICGERGMRWKNDMRADMWFPSFSRKTGANFDSKDLSLRVSVQENGKLCYEQIFKEKPSVPYRQLDMKEVHDYELHAYSVDGKTTHVKVLKDKLVKYDPIVTCHPADNFSFAVGVLIALNKIPEFHDALEHYDLWRNY